jgi:Ethanolamine utilization protein EutJ (predicted chaperonin)
MTMKSTPGNDLTPHDGHGHPVAGVLQFTPVIDGGHVVGAEGNIQVVQEVLS